MKLLSLWTLATATVSTVSAIQLAPRSTDPRVLGLDIEKRSITNILAHDKARRARLLKRQKTVEASLDNEEALYYANVSLGTPAQQIQLHIDTGSSDLWVNVANSSFCEDRSRPCVGGTFDPRASSTNKFVNSDFNITYLDGSGATGNYVSDTLEFGGVTIENFQFGLGLDSGSYQGVLGIGYVGNEVQVQVSGDQPYPNLPQALVNAGNINRNAYSLWLNDLDASTGTILFGGVNKAKYQSELETVPVYSTRGQYTGFIVGLTSFGLNGSAVTSSNLPAPVILDSGSTICRLPNDIVAAIYDRLDVVYESSEQVGFADCAYQNSNAWLDFGFNGVNIQVPFNELFLDAGTDEDGNPLTFRDGTPACLFGIAPAMDFIPILGDTFLRSAYVVYDLELNEVSLAQTVFNATDNNVVEIAAGTAPIPGATPVLSTISRLAEGTATNSARFGTATGAFTVTGANPSSVNLGPSTASIAPTASAGATGSPSSSNIAYATQVPYLAGAIVAAAGLLL